MNNYKRLIRYLRPYRMRLGMAMLSMLIVGAMTGALALVVKNVLDDIFINHDVDMLKLIPFILIAINVVKGVFMYAQSYLMVYVGQSVVRDIRDELYSHIQIQPLSFFAKNPTGTLMSRITYDVNMISRAVAEAFSSLLRDSFTLIVLIGVIFYRDWQLAMIALFIYPAAIYPIAKFGRKMRKIGTKSQETMGDITSFLHETISGARVVKAFGMEKYESSRFAGVNRKIFELIVSTGKIQAASSPVMEALGSVGFAVMIWYGGSKVMNADMTTGEFFSFLTALMMLYQPVKKLSVVNNMIQEGLSAAERIFAILDVEPDIREKESAIDIDTVRESVKFEQVSFAYGDEDVISSLDLTVLKGERIALVGSSGAGKTTFVNLIPRFYDVTGGGIKIDGCDIRDLKLKSLRKLVSIVTQETVLFNDTVRNNIAYGHTESPHGDVVAAATAAFAHDFIMELPDAYDTVIGEQGFRLSGGQRQRLSIARAIFKDAPVLILDEATSALDTESEKLVQNALNNLMRNRTSFVIAHRLSTIKSADRILVMSGGKIEEEGTHDALLSKKGLYRKLWDRQFADD